jgi:hypothetical protein
MAKREALMSYFPDLCNKTKTVSGSRIRAIGWLDDKHDYPQGDIEPSVQAQLDLFATRAATSNRDLGWHDFMGSHTCELCWLCHGSWNFGVPAGEQIYACPEMLSHYVRAHRYLPPPEFIAALMACPLPGTPEYRRAIEPFRVHQSRGRRAKMPSSSAPVVARVRNIVAFLLPSLLLFTAICLRACAPPPR